MPGDVLHRSTGHQDPLETDGFSVGVAHFCPRRSASLTHSFCTWVRSSPWAVFPSAASTASRSAVPGSLSEVETQQGWLTSVICHSPRQRGIKTNHYQPSEAACKTPSDSCSQHLDPDTLKRNVCRFPFLKVCMDGMFGVRFGGFMFKDSLFGKKE